MKNNKGFSLVELIVVIAIMAILAAVAIPTFASFITKANVAADVDFINNVEYAAELAIAATGGDAGTATIKLDANKNATEIAINDIIIVETGAKAGQDLTDAEEAFATDVAAVVDWDYTFKSLPANATCALNTDGKTINGAATFPTVEEEVENDQNQTPAEGNGQ